VAVDARIELHRAESVMRHFLALSLSKVTLALGVLQATRKRFLKALARGARALAARRAPARRGAIPLPMVAALADAQLFVAPGAVEQPVAGLDDGSTSSSQKAGQRRSITSLSARDKRYRQSAGTSQKAQGGHLGPSPLSEPGFPIAFQTRAKPTPSPTRLARGRRAEKYKEETQSDLRRR
jgi:hypothetical protein